MNFWGSPVTHVGRESSWVSPGEPKRSSQSSDSSCCDLLVGVGRVLEYVLLIMCFADVGGSLVYELVWE